MDKTICELFAGVGGFHLGFSNSNNDWNVVFANQFEPNKNKQHAFNCYKSHFPNTYSLNLDISEINKNYEKYNIPKYNLLVGGFPCQDYSIASVNAKGIEGKKGVLWWEINEFLKRDKPSFVLLENVDRLLKSPSKQRGRDFAIILSCFRDLGYSVEWRVINASDYGFYQKRKRVFLFACLNTTNYYKSIVKDLDSHNFIKLKGFFSDEFKIKDIINHSEINFYDDIISIQNNFEFDFLNSGIMINNKIISQKYTPLLEKSKKLRDILEENVDDKYFLKDKVLEWQKIKDRKFANRTTKDGFSYVYRAGAMPFPDSIDKPSRTIITSESSKNRTSHVIEDLKTKELRVLTPVECERLNGFDDNWTDTNMPHKFRYFCMGNALVVGLIEKMAIKLNKIFDYEI